MASDIFAKIGDIKGESADSKHKGEIDILSFSWGVTNSGTIGGGGGGGGRQGHIPRSFVHAHHRQGVAAAAEGLRDR